MNKFLPTAWVAMSVLAAIVWIAASMPLFARFGLIGQLPRLLDLIPTMLLYGSFAIMYAIFRRTTNSRLVFRLGWVHLFCTVIERVGGGYFLYLRFRNIARDEPIPIDVAAWAALPVTFMLLGGVTLLAVVWAAFLNTRKRIELQTFD